MGNGRRSGQTGNCRRNRLATTRIRRPEAWMEQVATHGHGIDAETPVPPQEAAEEALLTGLRLTEGIDPAAFERATGVPLAAKTPRRKRV